MFDPQARPSRGRALYRRLRGRVPRRRTSFFAGTPSVESLESRLALSASTSGANPGLVLLSATTTDSQSVTVDYSVASSSAVATPVELGVYRSADATFSAGDLPVASVALVPADSAGVHSATLSIPGGLPPDPARPYVLVVSDPTAQGATTDPGRTASFRTYVIGIVTHGGLEDPSDRFGPPWELGMARALRGQGYDAVIPFSWVVQSNHPGAAVKQGPRLARTVLKVAKRFPASAPIDLHFIGHSEGTVVNSVAIRDLETDPSPQIGAGYVEMTMLDPHSASTKVTGKQYSVSSGFLGWIARVAINVYQSEANDPAPFVPPGVDNTQVFYEHTAAAHAHGENLDIYNLWGQVPVRGPASYFNLSAAGVTHSGKTGIVVWYRRNVVPTLSNGPAFVTARDLTGEPSDTEVRAVGRADRRVTVASVHRPSFSGTAAPGSSVRILAGPASDPSRLATVARTVADPDGAWSATSRPLPNGRHRFLAVARGVNDTNRAWRSVLAFASLGAVDVRAGRGGDS